MENNKYKDNKTSDNLRDNKKRKTSSKSRPFSNIKRLNNLKNKHSIRMFSSLYYKK